MTGEIELWRPVIDWPYEVSSSGNVRNIRSGRVLAKSLHKSGYMQVQLWSSGKLKTSTVHRLVAAAFVSAQPSRLHEVAHGDGDRTNNNAENLRWVLHIENMRDRDRHGTTARGAKNGKLKHPDSLVLEARKLYAKGFGSRKIAKILGISRGTVYGYIKKTRRPVTEYAGCAV